ncbi:GAF domain-containing protein [Deinococcus hopiensis]|uniref:histidine kinase n=1 Tax=Deinococcus hopiensis KR-140 TaxID=695939 RepID=A0A1W1UBL8_9DEIO|nr:GAF domain-containing protein [Deinococcus hopiensis]SMB78184.1 Bacteriophytochrome (light-regulated signal transduction histidine kinase) [Deinococcus hopiensis KR-140]
MPLSTEKKIQDWLEFVQLLGQTDQPEDVAQAVIDEGIGAIGADGGFMSLRSPSAPELTFTGSYAYEEHAVAFLKTVPLSAQLPFVLAYNRREALFLESLEQARQDYPEVVPYIRDFHGSVVDLPLLVDEEALGVLVLSFREPRTFTPYERIFLRVLAAQCAQAIQRSRVLHQERQARQQAEVLRERFAFLASATQTLSTSLELTDTLETLTRLAVPRLADWCSVSLPQGDHLVPVAVAHEDPSKIESLRKLAQRYPVSIESSGSVGHVFRTGQPLLIPVITEDDMLRASGGDEHYIDSVRALQLHSMLYVPLTAHGRTLGVLGLASSTSEHTYGEQDIPFVLEVAGRAALAVENASLYATLQQELEQRTRAQREVAELNTVLEQRVQERTRELEAVNADMEAFTYSASHDLRSPVRHVKSFSELLRHRLGTEDQRAAHLLGQIQSAATRMDEITQGLLDLARVTRMEVEFRPVPLHPLLREVMSNQALDLGDRPVHWDVEPLPAVQGDARLLRQVFENLLGNAVKYTRPRTEARIAVQAEVTATEVIVRVSDNGVGFDPERAGKLFGVFQRLHHSEEFEGTGVGLATVQRIMKRHGGRVWAESLPDRGATFSVAFPRRHIQRSAQ